MRGSKIKLFQMANVQVDYITFSCLWFQIHGQNSLL